MANFNGQLCCKQKHLALRDGYRGYHKKRYLYLPKTATDIYNIIPSPRHLGRALLPRRTSRPHSPSPANTSPCASLGTPPHQLAQSKVAPRGLSLGLCSPLDPKRGMLIRHDVVLVLGVDGLVMCRNVDVVRGQFVAAKLLHEVCVTGTVEVDLGVMGVLVLGAAC